MKKETLPSIRIDSNTKSLVKKAINKYNNQSGQLVKMSIASFRRLSYEVLAKIIILDKDIPVKIEVE